MDKKTRNELLAALAFIAIAAAMAYFLDIEPTPPSVALEFHPMSNRP